MAATMENRAARGGPSSAGRAWRAGLIGAVLGMVGGIVLSALEAAGQGLVTYVAFTLDVTLGLALIGALIAVNCIRIHD